MSVINTGLDYIRKRMEQKGYKDFDIDEVSFTLAPSDARDIDASKYYLFVVQTDSFVEITSDDSAIFSPSKSPSEQRREHKGRVNVKNLNASLTASVELLQVIPKK
jgi:hypothetical protein